MNSDKIHTPIALIHLMKSTVHCELISTVDCILEPMASHVLVLRSYYTALV